MNFLFPPQFPEKIVFGVCVSLNFRGGSNTQGIDEC